jgi:succinoglycan biosynthesis protein ExoA
MSSTTKPQVSIIVACRDEKNHIGESLESVLAQDWSGLEWEIIVADGMSDDGTRAVLERYGAKYPEFRILSNPGRIVSAGLNAAILAARGEYVLRMDAHTSYSPDYVRRCLETLLRTGADNVGGPARTRPRGIVGHAVAAAYHSRFSTGGAPFHQVDFQGWVDTVPYGCWRKATLLKLGLFDETLVRNQDDELNLRLLRSGGKIWQDPAIVSWYTPRSSLSGLFNQYLQYGFWKVEVIRMHRIPGSFRHLVPALFVLGNVLAPVTLGICAVAGAREMLTVVATLWLSQLAIYGSATLVASYTAARSCGLKALPYLPVVFATYHVSYGLGFLAGLFRFRNDSVANIAESAFSRITR